MFWRTREGTGLAGLEGGTTVAGLPTVRPAQDEAPGPRPEWPLVLVMALVAVVGAWSLIGSEWGEYDGAERRPTVAGLPVPQLPAISPGSSEPFTTPARFERALRTIRERAGGGARAVLMRVDAGQVWAVVSRPDGSRRVMTVRADGTRDLGSTDGPVEGVPLSSIDVRVPQRLLAALQRRFRVPADRVDYVVLAHFPQPGAWSVFLKGGAHFSANLRGRKLVRVG